MATAAALRRPRQDTRKSPAGARGSSMSGSSATASASAPSASIQFAAALSFHLYPEDAGPAGKYRTKRRAVAYKFSCLVCFDRECLVLPELRVHQSLTTSHFLA